MSKAHLFNTVVVLVVLRGLADATPYRPSSSDPNSVHVVGGGSCRERGLCCTGRDRTCAISSQVSPGGPVSLLGNLIAAADNSAKECYCDSACLTLRDCCEDYKSACGVIDCRVSEWEAWSECDATCGVGSMSRSRTVLSQPQNGGKECLDLHQKRACHGQRCEVQDNDKLLRETAIVLQSSFSATRNIDENQDIRRNLRLNYPKDPIKETVNEYTVLFEITKSKKSCESLGPEVSGKLQEGFKVCVQCQEAAMRRHLGWRCTGHGSLGKSTRWMALGNTYCYGRWTRLDDREAANFCGGNKNGTSLSKNEPDFIFV